VSAKFSIPFCIAIAVKEKFVGLDSFSPSSLYDPEVRSLMKRIHVVVDPVMEQLYPDKWSAQIEIITRDGRSFKEYVDTPKGDPENPMSMAEIVDKYKDLTKSTGEHTRDLILKKVLRLETIKDMRELFDDSQDTEGAYAHN